MKRVKHESGDDLREIILVENADELFSLAENMHDNMWFRGVSRANYRLVPKVIRNAEVVEDQFGRYIDPKKYRYSFDGDKYLYPNFIKMLDIFKDVVSKDELTKANTDFDWLFIAQHYGLPTPLLDWTTDFNVAIWFATQESQEMLNSKDIFEKHLETYPVIDIRRYELDSNFSAIYIINPNEINEMSVDFKNVLYPVDTDEHFDLISVYLSTKNRPYSPLCIRGKEINVRLVNQKGNFTIHGHNIWAIDYYTDYRNKMTKILIPSEIRKDIINYLNLLDINEYYIYNGVDAKEYAALAIEKCENNHFVRNINGIRNENEKRK